MSISFIVLIIVVSIATYTDITSFRIPNWLCLVAMALGMSLQIFEVGWIGIIYASIYACAGGLPLFVLYLCKGVGAGDVKLFAALGAIGGIPLIFHLLILSFLCAGVVSLVFMFIRVLKRNKHYSTALLRATEQHHATAMIGIKKVHQFPFMLAVAPATCILLLFI